MSGNFEAQPMACVAKISYKKCSDPALANIAGELKELDDAQKAAEARIVEDYTEAYIAPKKEVVETVKVRRKSTHAQYVNGRW